MYATEYLNVVKKEMAEGTYKPKGKDSYNYGSLPSIALRDKCREIAVLMKTHLNHFPRHETHSLCAEMRNAVTGIIKQVVVCQKKYQNKTSLRDLDIAHEQLRELVKLAYELGYYAYEHNKRKRTVEETLRRYRAISIPINELGAMIGGWIRHARADEVNSSSQSV